MLTVAQVAWAANDAYNDKGGNNSGVVTMKNSAHNGSSSFFGRMYTFKTRNQKVVVGACRGTWFETWTDGAKDVFNDMQLAIGALPNQKTPAMRFAREVIAEASGQKASVLFTGHSLGGGLIQYMSLGTQKPAIGFCSAGIKGLQSALSFQGVGKILEGWAQWFGTPPLIRDAPDLAHVLVNYDQVVGALHHAVVGKRRFVDVPTLYKHSMDTLYKELSQGGLTWLGRRSAFGFVWRRCWQGFWGQGVRVGLRRCVRPWRRPINLRPRASI